MFLLKKISVAFAAFVMMANVAYAGNTFNSAQEAQIQKIVRQYLLKNPEILNQMFAELQQKQYKALKARTLSAIPKFSRQLFDAKLAPVAGNKRGDVTVVEFLDYQCVHCRNVAKPLDNVINADKKVRVIFKAVSFFGARSAYAAKATIAAQKQGKFYPFHMALLSSSKPLSTEQVLSIAKSVGLNLTRLKSDIKRDSIDKEVKANTELAAKLGVRGTPSFIVSKPDIPSNASTQGSKPTFYIPGEVDEDALTTAIDSARKQNNS